MKFFVFFLMFGGMPALADHGHGTQISLSCHEGLREQCQGCTFYEVYSDLESKEIKFFEQSGMYPKSPEGQPQYFSHVKLKQYWEDGKLAYHFVGTSTKAMAKAYAAKGIVSSSLYRLIHVEFDVQNVTGSRYDGFLQYKILGTTIYSIRARCDAN